jgi:hypothetical protein
VAARVAGVARRGDARGVHSITRIVTEPLSLFHSTQALIPLSEFMEMNVQARYGVDPDKEVLEIKLLNCSLHYLFLSYLASLKPDCYWT